MAEWTNALVLKTRGGKTPVGSNPTASAQYESVGTWTSKLRAPENISVLMLPQRNILWMRLASALNREIFVKKN